MEYMSAQEAADKWGITKRRVQVLCSTNRIRDAVRIGNMWILPAASEKPKDERFKKSAQDEKKASESPVRSARNKIKAITAMGMRTLTGMGMPFEEAKISLISMFATELLFFLTGEEENMESYLHARQSIERITNCQIEEDIQTEDIRSKMRKFIEENTDFLDDALSWCYQFANKFKSGVVYSNTQFFTEKYMITTIVDAINITSRKKIMDICPAYLIQSNGAVRKCA